MVLLRQKEILKLDFEAAQAPPLRNQSFLSRKLIAEELPTDALHDYMGGHISRRALALGHGHRAAKLTGMLLELGGR